MSLLNPYINSEYIDLALHFGYAHVVEKVVVITVDGRTIAGVLMSTDKDANLVLNDTQERIIRPQDDPMQSSVAKHGLYMIRGDNVVLCGLMDEDVDAQINWEEVRGAVIKSTKNI
jgi:U6 snRNA-associated Sm-like protein LSm8